MTTHVLYNYGRSYPGKVEIEWQDEIFCSKECMEAYHEQ